LQPLTNSTSSKTTLHNLQDQGQKKKMEITKPSFLNRWSQQ